jgi:uncharacterized protein YbcV (DUF1398 family)
MYVFFKFENAVQSLRFETCTQSYQTQFPQFLTDLWKNEFYQMFINICKPNLAYFTSIIKNWVILIAKNLPYQTISIKSNKNVEYL